MTRKTMVALIVAVGLMVAGATAFAYGPGGWGGRGPAGPGMMGAGPGWGYGLDNKFYQDTAKLRNDLYQKHLELNGVLAAPKVDEAKAKALQTEINKLRSEMSDKTLAAQLEFRKNNPDAVAQGYGPGGGPGWGRGPQGGYGPGAGQGWGRGPQGGPGQGWGPGPHMGYGRGMGYGPGGCWQ